MEAPRRIRSFVLRAGRVTVAQERALTELWPAYGLDLTGAVLELDAAFGRQRPAAARCLEIGFGAGEVIGALAQQHPDNDYLGIEVHRAGVGRLLLQLAGAGVANARIICHDAVDVLKTAIGDAVLGEILIFFPDPWHKKRHRKRRLIDAAFVELLADKLVADGTLRLATDWQDYATQMLDVCNANPRLVSMSEDRTFVARPELRPITRFERRGERLGHPVWDLAFLRR